MDLKKYFSDNEGMGILSTSDDNGRVNSAVYSKPHFVSENEVVFLMANRRSHGNIQQNRKPFANRHRRLFLHRLGSVSNRN